MEGLVALFLFPVLAGYIILTKTRFYGVRTHAYPVPRLFAESLLIGVGLLYLSSFFIFLIKWKWDIEKIPTWFDIHLLWGAVTAPLRNELNTQPKLPAITKLPTHLTNQAVMAVVMAGIYVMGEYFLLRSWYKKIGKFGYVGRLVETHLDRHKASHELAILKERDRYGGSIERMFALSMNSVAPLMLTMKNRKVYIALITELPPFTASNRQQRFISIYPIFSGYRETETLKLNPDMTDYEVISDLLLMREGIEPDEEAAKLALENIIKKADPGLLENLDMGIMIDADEIIAASLWDGEIYKEFNRREAISLQPNEEVQNFPNFTTEKE